jgi:hypothetical protein
MLYHHLSRHPELLDHSAEPTYVRHGLIRSWSGMLVSALHGVVGNLVTPLIALVGFNPLPAFYFLTSEGLPGGRDNDPLMLGKVGTSTSPQADAQPPR